MRTVLSLLPALAVVCNGAALPQAIGTDLSRGGPAPSKYTFTIPCETTGKSCHLKTVTVDFPAGGGGPSVIPREPQVIVDVSRTLLLPTPPPETSPHWGPGPVRHTKSSSSSSSVSRQTIWERQELGPVTRSTVAFPEATTSPKGHHAHGTKKHTKTRKHPKPQEPTLEPRQIEISLTRSSEPYHTIHTRTEKHHTSPKPTRSPIPILTVPIREKRYDALNATSAAASSTSIETPVAAPTSRVTSYGQGSTRTPAYTSGDPPRTPSYSSGDPARTPSYATGDPPRTVSYYTGDPPRTISWEDPSTTRTVPLLIPPISMRQELGDPTNSFTLTPLPPGTTIGPDPIVTSPPLTPDFNLLARQDPPPTFSIVPTGDTTIGIGRRQELGVPERSLSWISFAPRPTEPPYFSPLGEREVVEERQERSGGIVTAIELTNAWPSDIARPTSLPAVITRPAIIYREAEADNVEERQERSVGIVTAIERPTDYPAVPSLDVARSSFAWPSEIARPTEDPGAVETEPAIIYREVVEERQEGSGGIVTAIERPTDYPAAPSLDVARSSFAWPSEIARPTGDFPAVVTQPAIIYREANAEAENVEERQERTGGIVTAIERPTEWPAWPTYTRPAVINERQELGDPYRSFSWPSYITRPSVWSVPVATRSAVVEERQDLGDPGRSSFSWPSYITRPTAYPVPTATATRSGGVVEGRQELGPGEVTRSENFEGWSGAPTTLATRTKYTTW